MNLKLKSFFHLNASVILPFLGLKLKPIKTFKHVPLLSLLALLSGCSHSKDSHHSNKYIPTEVGVEAYLIPPQRSSKIIDSIGEFTSLQSTSLTSETMGVVSFLDIPEGKEVKAGHIIAKIEDSTPLAELNTEKAKFQNAETNFKRMKGLFEEGAISKKAFDDSQEIFETSKAQLERAESVESKSIITAPFNGVLSLKKVSLGSFVDPGDEIVKITQTNPLNLVFSIPEKYLSEIKSGQLISFYPSSQEGKENKKQSRITAIDPYIDDETRAIKIQSEVSNPNRNFLPGGFAKVELEVKSNINAVLIPEEAVINESSGKTVYLITTQNNALPKKVTIGKWENGFVEITSGLMTGDRVITLGHQKVFPGVMVIASDYVPIRNTFLEHGHPE